MSRTYGLKAVGLAACLTVAATACGQGGGSAPADSSGQTPSTITRGGTLNLGLTSDVSASFDPQKEYYSVTWEFYRCCLLRTLLTYPAEPGVAGGRLVPDLATALPEISADGLTYTFHIKPHIHYSPPLQNMVVTSMDVERALIREANPAASAGGYPFYYTVIAGFEAAVRADRNVNTYRRISGISTPDPSTLVIHLTQPTGDFVYRMAMPATAPIPPLPDHPKAPMGIATGHGQSFGPFLVGTGPYMFQGEQDLNFNVPPSQQRPVSGYQPGRSITLVRDPSWRESTDPVRKAYVNQIDAMIDPNASDLAQKVLSRSLDLDWGAPPPNVVQQYLSTPSLEPYIHSTPDDGTRYISMNLAQPPFDDIWVRRAASYVMDKAGLLTLRGGPEFGEIADHIVPNDMLGDTLDAFDPYPSPGGHGDLAKAKQMMMHSRYDTKHNGLCDAPACKNVLTVIDETDPYPGQAQLIDQDLSRIGITLDIKSMQRTTMYSTCDDPTKHVALCPSVGWFKDYSDPYTFMAPLFGSVSLYPACCNYSLLGATSGQLEKWGYKVKSVPNVDSRLSRCAPQMGQARITCYADLDRYLMTGVVPWIPYLYDNEVDITSTRLVNYRFDISAGLTALDQVALAGGGR